MYFISKDWKTLIPTTTENYTVLKDEITISKPLSSKPLNTPASILARGNLHSHKQFLCTVEGLVWASKCYC